MRSTAITVAPWDTAAWAVAVNNFKLNEVTTYHTLLNLNPGSYSTVMNRDTWNRLTEQEQAHLADLRPVYFFYNTTDGAATAMQIGRAHV